MRDLERLQANNPEMSKSAIVRKAIRHMSEEEAVKAILEAEREVKEGKIIREDASAYLRRRIKRG
ncbi:MAG TPA: hypothetical protein VJG29_00125 [Candidatus Paceibacterota bacterium]